MRNEFTAVFERDGEGLVADCPEIPAPTTSAYGAKRVRAYGRPLR